MNTCKTGTILAIDPGNEKSGYVLVEYDGDDIRKVIEKSKQRNEEIAESIIPLYAKHRPDGHVAIEMVAGMGMPVGQEVFDTCFWIGKFWAGFESAGHDMSKVVRICRREEKLDICGTLAAKDSNIRQALVDRYAPGQPNFGKGTKKEPGFFNQFSADIWQAMAVAVTYYDKYIKDVRYE